MAAFQSEMTIRFEEDSRQLLRDLVAVLERLAVVMEHQQGKEAQAIVHDAVEQIKRLRVEIG